MIQTAVLCLGLWCAGVSVVSVDGGLEALQQGATDLDVPTPVARQAAARIVPELADEALLRSLARLARTGRADEELAAALVGVLRGKGPLFRAALGELGALEPGAVARLDDEPLQDAVVQELSRLASAEGEAGAVLLLPPRVEPAALVALVQQWAAGPATRPLAGRLLRELQRTRAPAECLAALAQADVQGLRPERAELARGLVARSPAAADLALDAVEHEPGWLLLSSLGGVSLRDEGRRSRALAALQRVLGDARELPAELVAAAIGAAAEQLDPGLVPQLPGLLAAGPVPVRVAALGAMARVCYRDAPTIDLLIGAMSDPDAAVAAAGYEALLKKSGQQLPMRPEAWFLWRSHAALPDAAPADDEARLAQERRLRLKLAEQAPPAQRRPARAPRPARPSTELGAVPTSGGAAPAIEVVQAPAPRGPTLVAPVPGTPTAGAPELAAAPAPDAAPSRLRALALSLAPFLRLLWVGLASVAVVALLYLRARPAPSGLRAPPPPAATAAATAATAATAAAAPPAATARRTTSRLARLSQTDEELRPTVKELDELKEASQRFEDGLAALMAAGSAAPASPPPAKVEPPSDSVGHVVFRPSTRLDGPTPAGQLFAGPVEAGDPKTIPAAQLFGGSAEAPPPPPAAPLDPKTIPAAQLFGGSAEAPPPPPAAPLDPKTVPAGRLFARKPDADALLVAQLFDAPAPADAAPAWLGAWAAPAPAGPEPAALDPKTVPAAHLFGGAEASALPPTLAPVPLLVPIPAPPLPLPVAPPPKSERSLALFSAPAGEELALPHVLGLAALWKQLSEPSGPAASWEESRALLEPVVSTTPTGVEALRLLDRARQVLVVEGRPMTPAAEQLWARLLGELFRLAAAPQPQA